MKERRFLKSLKKLVGILPINQFPTSRLKSYAINLTVLVISNFKFTLPANLKAHIGLADDTQEKTIDEDGDLIVQRKDQTSDYSLAISKHIDTLLHPYK